MAPKHTGLDDDRRLIKLSEDCYVFGSYPFAGVVLTDEGCVAIDGPMSPRNSMPWAEFIDERGGARYQVYCEHHEDHTTSACYIKPDVLITSERTRAVLSSPETVNEALRTWGYDPLLEPNGLAGFEMRYPNLTYSDRLNLELGGKRFVLFEAPGHTMGSTVVHAVDDRVAFIADNGFTPAIQSGDVFAWVATIAMLETLDVDWFVQGHGEPFHKERLSEWREVLLGALDRAREADERGLTAAEFAAEGGPFGHFSIGDHVGAGDRPPRLSEFGSSTLQPQGALVMMNGLDRHPSEFLHAPAAGVAMNGTERGTT